MPWTQKNSKPVLSLVDNWLDQKKGTDDPTKIEPNNYGV